MRINLDLQSTSATKTQEANAKILFGKKGASILKRLEELSKEKLLQTDSIDIVLKALKNKDTSALEKFAASAPGKKFSSNALKLSKAKTPVVLFATLKTFKSPAALVKIAENENQKMPWNKMPWALVLDTFFEMHKKSFAGFKAMVTEEDGFEYYTPKPVPTSNFWDAHDDLAGIHVESMDDDDRGFNVLPLSPTKIMIVTSQGDVVAKSVTMPRNFKPLFEKYATVM